MDANIDSKTKLLSPPGRRWAIAISIAGLIATGATGVYSLKAANQKPSESLPLQMETAPIEAVSALGRLEPQGEVIQLAAPPNMGGAKVAQLLVEEGDTVTINQVIAVLDNRDRKQAAVELAKQEVKVAQANLAIVKAGAKTGEIKAQRATIGRLQAQLEGEIATNRAKIARLEAQLLGEKFELAATIDRLQAELDNAEREFERYRQLEKDGAISTSALDQRRLTLDTARERLKEAKASRKRIVETLTEQIREAKANFRQIQHTLDNQIQEAKANLDRIAEVRPVDVQLAQVQVEKAIASLKEAQTDLQLSYVKSPLNGEVLKIHTRPGENVNQENGIIQLGKTDQMMVIAEVYESDISKVQLGKQVTIISESGSFAGEIKGTVSKIGRYIGKKDVLDTDPAANVDVRVVEVKILINSEDSKVVSGLTYSNVIVKILL
ncbi:MAG: ABC exporter membrane fusion protein [Moorea sp. SIO2B7]|nr:ABC exporter membrane fusion protein [Moorena sp. SIO2B7]